MMEAPLKTLNLIDKLTGESWSSIASSSSSIDPLEHHRLLCIAASTFTLHQSWWQPPPSTTKKRKGKELAEEESAAPNNHPKRRKIVLTDHQQNIRELKKRSDLVTKNNDNESFLGLILGAPVRPTTLPAHDEQLKEIRDNRVAKHDDDDDSLLKLSVGTNEVHHYHQRPVVRHSDPAKFKIKKKLTPSDLGHLSRLLLPKDMVTNYILPKFDEDLKARMRSEVGLEVTVFDEVRQKEYELIFKYLKSSGSYVFNGKWTHDFVKELDLNKDDEIELYLDSSTTPSPKPKFHFSLLKLAGQADEGSPASSSTRKE